MIGLYLCATLWGKISGQKIEYVAFVFVAQYAKMSKRQQNSSLKMCVLNASTNNGTVTMRLIAIGRAFHKRGPTTLNERSPKLTSLVRGTSSRCCCDERVRPVEHCRFIMSARYSGPVPLMHRNTCRRILKLMRRFIGSQCSAVA